MKVVSYLLGFLFLIGALASISLFVPRFHYNYIRSKVGDRVVSITDKSEKRGGTGFHIKAPSGKTFILTNSHICQLKDEKNMLYVKLDRGRAIQKKVIEDSDFTDLCLIEPFEGISGLNPTYSVDLGEILAVVGHPSLFELTMSRGELISKVKLPVMDHYIPGNTEKEIKDHIKNKCSLPKHDVYESFFGPICIIKIESYISNITILPGNSGSPLVNFYGEVVGVAYAGTNVNWGMFVTIEDIKKFLSIY